MKQKITKKQIIILSIVLVALIAAAVLVFSIVGGKKNQVTNKISIEEAQKIVTDTISGLPAETTAISAQYIINNTKITVQSVEYGYEKDVILHCNYETLDTKGALSNEIDTVMEEVYTFYKKQEEKGRKVNATRICGEVSKSIEEKLKTANQISGEVTLYIYETAEGMKLYLSDEAVDTVTGGLITVRNKIKSTNTVLYNGVKEDISNKTTLRTGIDYCIALVNYSSDKPIVGNSIQKAWGEFVAVFKLNFIEKDRWTYLTKGLGVTLCITILAAVMGIILGFIVAIIRCTCQMTGKLKIPDAICRLYLTITRGTPVMVQLLIVYFVCLLPLKVPKFIAAVICFGLNSGAYVAEIVRGGIMSIDKGQIEAGRSLGFNYVQTMVHFIVPQAFKAILPSLANEFITLLKESSVAFTIGVADLTSGGNKIRSVTYTNFLPLIAVALIYLAMVMILSKLVSLLERRLAKSDH